jgi:subtilisin family serine protease
MKHMISGLLVLLALGACQAPLSVNSQNQALSPQAMNPQSPAAPRLMAQLQPAALKALQAQGLKSRLIVPEQRLYSLELPSGADPSSWQKRLSGQTGVDFVETVKAYQLPPEHFSPVTGGLPFKSGFGIQDLKPNDPQYSFQWNMRSIGMEKAWDLSTSAREVTVAVIDSGVDPDHPDLKAHLLPLEDIWGEFAGSDKVANRVTGETFDFGGRDGNGHGTHVAGIIGAVLNNATGVAGIAGGGVKILPIKVTNLTGATDSVLLVEAVKRAIDRGADVINMSIGTLSARDPALSQSLQAVIELARQNQIIVVAASGNESERSDERVEGARSCRPWR